MFCFPAPSSLAARARACVRDCVYSCVVCVCVCVCARALMQIINFCCVLKALPLTTIYLAHPLYIRGGGVDVLQAVIVGSAVDWASDPDLLETMVSLGEPYNG